VATQTEQQTSLKPTYKSVLSHRWSASLCPVHTGDYSRLVWTRLYSNAYSSSALRVASSVVQHSTRTTRWILRNIALPPNCSEGQLNTATLQTICVPSSKLGTV